MMLSFKRGFLFLMFLLLLSFEGFAQPCGPGQAPCGRDNTCKPVSECRGGPPPPGLVVPINSNIPFLLIAGLGLGIYFLIGDRKKGSA